jgi:hypothetical protein
MLQKFDENRFSSQLDIRSGNSLKCRGGSGFQLLFLIGFITSILSFLFDIPQTITPACTKSWHNARPIPTDAPVTTEKFKILLNFNWITF